LLNVAMQILFYRFFPYNMPWNIFFSFDLVRRQNLLEAVHANDEQFFPIYLIRQSLHPLLGLPQSTKYKSASNHAPSLPNHATIWRNYNRSNLRRSPQYVYL